MAIPSLFKKMGALAVAALIASVIFARCSSSNSGSSGPTTLSQLPTATGAVVSGSTGAQIGSAKTGADVWLESASTGTLLKNWASVNWSSSTSGPMCNTGNMVMNLLSNAGNADRMLCYSGAMQTGGLVPSTASLADGNPHYFQLVSGGQGPNLKLQIVMTKNGAGQIQTFKMFSCENTTNTNDSYNGVDLTNGATLVSVESYSQSGTTASERTTVTGTINGSGNWLKKNINAAGAFSSSGVSQQMQFTMVQYPSYANLSGFFTGTFGSMTQTGQIYSDFGILGANALSTFAIGNGTILAKFVFTGGGPNDSAGQTAGWNGDTDAPVTASSSDYYTQVSTATLPTAGSVNTAFQSSETWNCQADSKGFTQIDMSTSAAQAVMTGAIAQCDANLRITAGWADCHVANTP